MKGTYQLCLCDCVTAARTAMLMNTLWRDCVGASHLYIYVFGFFSSCGEKVVWSAVFDFVVRVSVAWRVNISTSVSLLGAR